MSIELKVPNIGESITEVQIGQWLLKEGERVEKDQPIVELESDKATVELPSPLAGVIEKLLKKPGDKAAIDEPIALIAEGPGEPQGQKKQKGPEKEKPKPGEQPKMEEGKKEVEDQAKPEQGEREGGAKVKEEAEIRQKVAEPERNKQKAQAEAEKEEERKGKKEEEGEKKDEEGNKEQEEEGKEEEAKGQKELEQKEEQASPPPVSRDPAPRSGLGERVREGEPGAAPADRVPVAGDRGAAPRGEEELVPMSPIRKRIAERLLAAQHNAALLTTYNEIDMSAVQALRQEYRDSFQQRFGVKLGLMSFFVKATIEALKQVPQLNAEIRGEDIAYRNYYDIGIAVSGGKGLVVPVLRNAERLSFAQIERAINDFAERAKDNKITLAELAGGTFTITNGGVFGSLFSTPIVNPPQSGVLGLHVIQDRPVARAGQVVIRPMMYVALTYDHRIVDGREAVQFLRHIKDVVENPARMLIEV